VHLTVEVLLPTKASAACAECTQIALDGSGCGWRCILTALLCSLGCLLGCLHVCPLQVRAGSEVSNVKLVNFASLFNFAVSS
jgi:hypothetical protein